MATDRRPILQKLLDQIEPDWIVVEPHSAEDIDDLCIFQKTAEDKEARVNLPVHWFDDIRIMPLIERAIRRAIQEAVVVK
jgi:hypothetical protein